VALEGTVIFDQNSAYGPNQASSFSQGNPQRLGMDLETPPLVRYLKRIQQGKWIILVAVLLSVAYSVWKIRQTPAVYESTAVLRIEPKTARLSQYASLQSNSGSYEDLQTAVDVINSLPVMELVVEQLGLLNRSAPKLEAPPEVSVVGRVMGVWRQAMHKFRVFLVPLPSTVGEDANDPNLILRNHALSLRGGVSVSRGEDNFLVYVRYRHNNPTFAATVANTICEKFITYLHELEYQPYDRLSNQLEEQTTAQRTKLENAQEDLVGIFVDDPVVSLPNALQLGEDRLSEALDELKSIEKEVRELGQKEAVYTDLNDPYNPLLSELNPALNEILDQRNEARLEMGSLRGVELGAEHPEVRALKSKLNELDLRVAEQVSIAKDALVNKKQLLQKQQTSLTAEVDDATSHLAFLHDRLATISRTKRDVELEQTLFDDLLATQKKFLVDQSFEPNRVTVIQAAIPGRFPISPNPRSELFGAVVLGLAIGIGLILILDYLDHTVHNAFELEELAHLPTLGYIPFFRGASLGRGGASRNLYENPDAPDAEAYRFLRTSMMYATPDERKPKLLLMTSSVSREGKTTTSLNLGVTMARLGARTLVVDADVKRPSCHQVLGLERKPGLVDYLTGNTDNLDSCIKPTKIDDLYLMPTGSISPAASDLFESASLDQLLAELRDKFDFVIIDSFPLTVGAGSFVLSSKVDAVALVVVPGRTPRDLLIRNIHRLRAVNAQVIGGIYNFATANAEKNTQYGYGYGYSYGYYGYKSYGTDNDDELDKKDIQKRLESSSQKKSA
jgi:capsular exopolysaccharide synthesis family protein